MPAAAHEPEAQLTAPVLIERAAPVYPPAALAAGVGGTVGLELTVAADGSVAAVKVTRAAGFGLDEAAAAAARRFRFKPATQAGQPIASTILYEERFVVRPRLQDEVSGEAAPSPLPETAPAVVGVKSYQSTVVSRGPTSAASSSTIRNLDFELRPKSSPNDVLRVVPGLLTAQHQGGGKADQIFLRGFDADHGTDVGIFVDGVPINLPSHAHGQGYADLHWIIPEALERIDVVKGPYEARWGDFSTAGAVNLVTRKLFESSSVQYTLGMYPTQDGRLAALGRFLGVAAPTLPGWAARLHPWVAFEAAYDQGPFLVDEQLRRYNLFAKLSYDLSPRTDVGLFFSAYGSGWIGSGQIPQREVRAGRLSAWGSEDPSEGGQTERQMLTLFLRHKDADDEVEATVYLTRYRLALWNDFTFFLEHPITSDEIEQDDARVYSGGTLAWHFHRRWRSISFRTTLGAQARWDGVHVDRWDAESQNGDFRLRLGRLGGLGTGGNNDDITTVDLGAWLEEDVVWTRWLRTIAAMRVEYFGFDVSDLNGPGAPGQPPTSGTRQFVVPAPKASVVLTPIQNLLDLYLNFGMGFHSNQAEVALVDGKTQQNSSGGTYTVHAIPLFYGGEIGARAHLWNRVDLAAALWASYLENETVFDADHATFVPSAPTRRLGFDFELRARILRWLFADLDLAQASATAVLNGGNGGAVALAPRLYITGGLTVKHVAGERGTVRAGLRFRYLADRPAFDESSPEYRYFTSRTLPGGAPNPDYDPARVTAVGYFIVDLYGAYRWHFLEASVSIQNLFNSDWREAQFGNRSCTFDETWNQANPHYAGPGRQLSDGSYVDRCGAAYGPTRSGVADVHLTPGVPINLEFTLKAYF